ncbi:unannotated protein [freshwater metagenome]|uniref:Unannotated protein n=1 Tax=freshwater metagenome TaxID=449393 RepID=A0A6J7CW23_9ZZZZ
MHQAGRVDQDRAGAAPWPIVRQQLGRQQRILTDAELERARGVDRSGEDGDRIAGRAGHRGESFDEGPIGLGDAVERPEVGSDGPWFGEPVNPPPLDLGHDDGIGDGELVDRGLEPWVPIDRMDVEAGHQRGGTHPDQDLAERVSFPLSVLPEGERRRAPDAVPWGLPGVLPERARQPLRLRSVKKFVPIGRQQHRLASTAGRSEQAVVDEPCECEANLIRGEPERLTHVEGVARSQ